MARFSRAPHPELEAAVQAFEANSKGLTYTDYRLPANRRKAFQRYYNWRITTYDLDHTHYLNVLSEGYDFERKAWLAFTFGMTYRTPQAFAYTETFNHPHNFTIAEVEDWHKDNWQRTTYGTDARYNKGHFVKQYESVKNWLGEKTFKEKFEEILVHENDLDNFKALYNEVQSLYKYGRMTGWLCLQGIYDLLKLPIDPHQILLEGYNPERDSSLGSIWNGLCALENREELQVGKYGTHKITQDDLDWGGPLLLEETHRAGELAGKYVDSFRNESIWCQYKRLYNKDMSLEYPGHACFPKGTKIKLLDGTDVNIEDLVGRSSFLVYSCTPDGQIVAGEGHSARMTKRVTELTEVMIDNGEVIRSTTDHRFMMRDGSYKEAKDLKPADSLMPLYLIDSEDDRYSQNHREVVSVKIIFCEEQEVYDITVDEYHNFALDSGIFVHNSGDATSRYLYYREHWPEIDWSKFRKALRTQPGIVKGQTFVPWKNQFFGRTGQLFNLNEIYEDELDLWDLCELDPQQYLVKELWLDDNLPVPTNQELKNSFKEDIKHAPKYWT